MIQRGKLVIIVIISIIATIVAGVNIKQAVERQMEESGLDAYTVNKIEIQDIKIYRHPEKEEKNIDEAVTTIDEVEADEQGQLAANAGGSGEAEMAETNEEDVYTDMGNEEVPEDEKVDLPETSVNFDGAKTADEAFKDTDSFELPSEERRQEISDKIDEYGTVLQ